MVKATKTVTAKVTKTATLAGEYTDKQLATLYAPYLRDWPKRAGEKPTFDMLRQAHAMGGKAGKAYTFAWAMYLRPEGATKPEVSAVCNGPQYNKANDAVTAGQLAWLPVEPRGGASGAGHKVYKLGLPVKAKAKVSKPKAKKPEVKKPEVTKTEAEKPEVNKPEASA